MGFAYRAAWSVAKSRKVVILDYENKSKINQFLGKGIKG